MASIVRSVTMSAAAMTLALLAALIASPAVSVPSIASIVPSEEGSLLETDALAREDRLILEDVAGPGASVREIASDGTLSFYVLTKADGGACLASGYPNSGHRFGSITCPDGGPGLEMLPTAARPLYEEVAVWNLSSGQESAIGVSGLAADGVVRVNALDLVGRVVRTSAVTNHVFRLTGLGATDVVEIVALDASGNVLYQKSLLSPESSLRLGDVRPTVRLP